MMEYAYLTQRTAGLCERVWDEREVFSVGKPVHAEVPVIQREHGLEMLALGETDEGGIR